MGQITAVFGTHQDNTLEQLQDVAGRAELTALMADGHLGYVMPIGGVAAYKERVSVVGVGFDIACGNAAIRTDLSLGDITGFESDLADEIQGTVSFGVGRNNNANDAPVDHPLFESDVWSLITNLSKRDSLRAKARKQLGTVGSGNHYVDVFVDENGTIWVGVHFGSRGFGHTVASGFLNLSQGKEWGAKGAKEAEVLLPLDQPLGHDYWHLMELAGQYAYVGREWVARKVVSILGGNELELVHNHHNFAWREKHFSQEYIVVRKGATPAFPGQKGFIGGSMGDDAVIVEGKLVYRDEETMRLQEQALFSTVHGAGRVMSRNEAKKGRMVDQSLADLKLPNDRLTMGHLVKMNAVRDPSTRITSEMQQQWLTEKGVILRGGGVDESPHVYRRLPDVLSAQGNTIEVLHTLRPLIVVMAGANEFDPYKD